MSQGRLDEGLTLALWTKMNSINQSVLRSKGYQQRRSPSLTYQLQVQMHEFTLSILAVTLYLYAARYRMLDPRDAQPGYKMKLPGCALSLKTNREFPK